MSRKNNYVKSTPSKILHWLLHTRVNLVCNGGFPIFLIKFLHRPMLTLIIEPEGVQACINRNRDGPHRCHWQHKGLLILMDVREASVIGDRLLGLVFAVSILSKGKEKSFDHCHPLPGEHEFKTVCSLRIPKSSLLWSIPGAEMLLVVLKWKH